MRNIRACLAVLCLFSLSAIASAESIEIDWEIIVDAPHPDTVSPEISLIMAAMPSLDYDFAEFRINPAPTGGVTTDVWWAGSYRMASAKFNGGPLTQPLDTIRCTTKLDVVGSGTTYAITALSSKTWGTVPVTQLPSCSTTILGKISFSLPLTLQESEIELGRNRVARMAITEVRYTQGKKVDRDTTLRIIYERPTGTVSTQLDQNTVDSKTAY